MYTQTLDRQVTPARSASKTSLAKVPATCVQDVCIGYMQDVLVFETLQIIVKPMAGSGLPVCRYHSHTHLHHRLVPHTRPPCQTSRSTYYSGTQQTDGTKHLPRGAQRQSGGHSEDQAHCKIEKSKHPELRPSTT